jgi:hypothetical protein
MTTTTVDLLLVFVITLFVISQVDCRDYTPEEVASKIAASDELQHIDKICSEIPKPPSFKQIKKGISGNAIESIVYYQYQTGVPFSAVRAFYEDPSLRGDYNLLSVSDHESIDYRSEIRLAREDVGIIIEHRPPSGIFVYDCFK